jgi:hypothetical protein
MISWACSFMAGKVLKVKVFHVQDKVDNYITDRNGQGCRELEFRGSILLGFGVRLTVSSICTRGRLLHRLPTVT